MKKVAEEDEVAHAAEVDRDHAQEVGLAAVHVADLDLVQGPDQEVDQRAGRVQSLDQNRDQDHDQSKYFYYKLI